MKTTLVGIVNVTPDSFSDGGKFLDSSDAIDQAAKLVRDGAEIIDVGAESTRPGSKCISEEEEWGRLSPVLGELTKKYFVSVDTHNPAIAEKSLELGAKCINDIASSSEMLSTVAKYKDAKIIIMHSRCRQPHIFAASIHGNIIKRTIKFFEETIDLAVKSGIDESRIILDPGMGAFISDDPKLSWNVLANLKDLTVFNLPILLGVSRKGFLKRSDEDSILERDGYTAYSTSLALEPLKDWDGEVLLRVHNPAIHVGFRNIRTKFNSHRPLNSDTIKTNIRTSKVCL